MERVCLDCQAPIKGRADKKFCDDNCRSNFNNAIKAKELVFLKRINTVLWKNRKILRAEIADGETIVNRQSLIRKGFNFNYHTHTSAHQTGAMFCCYEFGYLPIGSDEILLVKRQEHE